MPGAEKTSVAKIFSDYGIPYFTLSSVLSEELAIRGIDPTPTNYAKLALELRKKFGEDIIARRTWDLIETSTAKSDIIIIDGIRSPAEVLFFRTVGKRLFLVLVHSSPETRFRRFKQRKRRFISTREKFEAQDRGNFELGGGEVIAQADYVIINETYCKKDIKGQIRDLYRFLKKKMQTHDIGQEKTPKE